MQVCFRVYTARNFLSSPSSSLARNLIYIQARAEPSLEIPLSSKPEPSLARISHLLGSSQHGTLWSIAFCNLGYLISFRRSSAYLLFTRWCRETISGENLAWICTMSTKCCVRLCTVNTSPYMLEMYVSMYLCVQCIIVSQCLFIYNVYHFNPWNVCLCTEVYIVHFLLHVPYVYVQCILCQSVYSVYLSVDVFRRNVYHRP